MTTLVTYISLVILLVVFVYIQELHAPAWGGWNFKEITWEQIKVFCDLYVPTALSSASDFWRVALIGLVTAKLGEEEVAVFNTSYRIMWIALIVIGSLASSSAINMSLQLGKMNSKGAQQAGYVGLGMSAAILAIMGLLLLVCRRLVARRFTNDLVFLDMLKRQLSHLYWHFAL